ncbi:MAG: hypothetical protein II846_02770 [Acetobacter sp.]|nr:hypothetical protein [Acetobacter sp.]
MKRVLFFLTQIPIWLFIGCFFGSVLLGSPLPCHAQTFNSGGILSQQTRLAQDSSPAAEQFSRVYA